MNKSIIAGAVITLLIIFYIGSVPSQAQQDISQIIYRAGSTEDDKECYRILKELSQSGDLDASLRKDLEMLLPAIDAWTNGQENMIRGDQPNSIKKRYLPGFFHKKVKPDNDFPGYVSEDSPLYPIWCMYRARFLVWYAIEYHTLDDSGQFYDEARKLFQVTKEAFPGNRILGMYLGEPIPWKASFAYDSRAPKWANLQREAIEKLADIIHFWIDYRQLPDGQYGGAWGDDCEMWRWWTPLLIGFEDEKIINAQIRLSAGLMGRPHMKDGYHSDMYDVEHGSEDSSDSLTPAVHLVPLFRDNPEGIERLRAAVLRLAELMRTNWCGINERGFLQFKSVYFNAYGPDPAPEVAYDTVYHPRAVEPLLIYWQITGDKNMEKIFTSWMDTWVDAAAREENGKPAGIIPSAIHWPSGSFGVMGKKWWKPEIYVGDLYGWPSAMGYMTKVLMLTYFMTGDEKYLEPVRSMVRTRIHYAENPPKDIPEPGSAAWCATIGGTYGDGMTSFLPETVVKLRALLDIRDYDDLLLQSNINSYVKMRLGASVEGLENELEKTIEAFRINKVSYTTEVRYTDRVLYFNRYWYNDANGWKYPRPDTSLLYSTLTGDPGSPKYFPMYGVRWLTEPRAFAALVTRNNTKQFEAQLFHFGEDVRDMGADLYVLKAGDFRMTLTDKDGNLISTQDVAIKGTVSRIFFKVPPRTLCRIQVGLKK